MSVSSPVDFAKGLSDPLQPNRLTALKNLNAWMDKNGMKHQFTSIEMDQFWRALQYTLWMADKRPVQQQVAAEIVLLIRKIDPSFATEWNRGFWFNLDKMYESVDKYRIPKFHLLIRIYVAELFAQMKSRDWDFEFVRDIMKVIPQNLTKAVGAYMQLMTVFLPELVATIESENLRLNIKPRKVFHQLLKPFLFLIENQSRFPISIVSKAIEAILADARVVNYSPETRELIKTTIQATAMNKQTTQDVREILFAAIETIESIPAKKTKKQRTE